MGGMWVHLNPFCQRTENQAVTDEAGYKDKLSKETVKPFIVGRYETLEYSPNSMISNWDEIDFDRSMSATLKNASDK